jgi:hypothetical protein
MSTMHATALTRGMRKRWPIAVTLAALGGFASAVIILTAARPNAVSPPPSPEPRPLESARVTVVELPSKASVLPANMPMTHVGDVPDDPAPSSAPLSTASAHKTSASTPHSNAKHVPPPPHRDASKCTPPFVVDADGIKHLKRECL